MSLGASKMKHVIPCKVLPAMSLMRVLPTKKDGCILIRPLLYTMYGNVIIKKLFPETIGHTNGSVLQFIKLRNLSEIPAREVPMEVHQNNTKLKMQCLQN